MNQDADFCDFLKTQQLNRHPSLAVSDYYQSNGSIKWSWMAADHELKYELAARELSHKGAQRACPCGRYGLSTIEGLLRGTTLLMCKEV